MADLEGALTSDLVVRVGGEGGGVTAFRRPANVPDPSWQHSTSASSTPDHEEEEKNKEEDSSVEG